MKTRKEIVNEAKRQREEIAQYFRDTDHWNNGRGQTEGVIEADPDGKMGRIAKALDDMLNNEIRISLNKGECPDCEAKDSMLKGPEGGIMTNIKCEKCGSTFNYCPPCAVAHEGIAHRI